MNTDCGRDKSCFNNKCVDPCSGTCGQNTECKVSNHVPSCYCLPGYTGNSLYACVPVPSKIYFLVFFFTCSFLSTLYLYLSFFSFMYKALPEPVDPCHPTPCGPYSKCRTFNDHAVCTCLDICIGSPPNCHPECMVSSDCRPNKACIHQKCQDPCPGMCGVNAQCQVVNHNPICSCYNGYTGDPFVRCLYDESK